MPPAMPSKTQPKPRRSGWTRVRVWFRRCRIAVLLFLFLLVCIGAYLNHVGLPGFIKKPLLKNLHQRGIDLQFSRLRLRWYRGIVADNVRLLGVESPVLPICTAQTADVQLDYAALLRRKVEVTGFTLRKGRLAWELAPTNEPPRTLVVSNITAALRFLPGNEWQLNQFTAEVAGARFEASGRIANGAALRDWPIFQGRTKSPPEVALARLRSLQAALGQIQLGSPLVFRASLSGDAQHPETFSGNVTCEGVSTITPWGELNNASLRAVLKAAGSDSTHSAELVLTAESATSKWGGLKDLDLRVTAARVTNSASHLDCDVKLSAAGLAASAGSVKAITLAATWRQPLTNALPENGTAKIAVEGLDSRWVRAGVAGILVDFAPSVAPPAADPALGIWNELLTHRLGLRCALTNIARSNIVVDALTFAADWSAPQLKLTGLQAGLPAGGLHADADLDVCSRRFTFDAKSDLNRIGRAHV